MTEIVALVGLAGAGKTTLAKLLEQRLDYVRVPLAAPIRMMLRALLTYEGLDQATITKMLDGDQKETPTKYLCDSTPRRAMQTLGTEWRNTIDRHLWTKAWRRRISTLRRVVVDDVRFNHEAQMIWDLGGLIVRIARPSLAASADSHLSETEVLLIAENFTITNGGKPEDMFSRFVELTQANGERK